MQIVVLFEKREGPWGGGNQFLKVLESQMTGLDSLPLTSRFLLVNSHHFGAFFRDLRVGISGGDRVIHRIDGPISSTRRTFQGLLSDMRIFLFSALVSDGVVFQSVWSRKESERLRFNHKQSTVIHNAPDPAIFYPSERRKRTGSQRKRVIVTSWSTNPMKGFDLLEEIAALLVDEDFEFLLIGNSPRTLENFEHLPPMTSEQLADELRSGDIYLSLSRNDSCSNSLVEAIGCGLVPVVIDSGGNPELVGVRELIFETVSDAASILRKDLATLRGYAEKIRPNTALEITMKYADFASQIDQTTARKNRRMTFEVFVVLDYLLRLLGWIFRPLSALRSPFKSRAF